MKTFDERLDEVTDLIIKMVWNYTVFRELFKPGEENTEARRQHFEFFATMYESLFCTFSNYTWILFHEKDKAESIVNLIKHIETTNPTLAASMQDKITAKEGSIETIEKMRNQAFAHRYITSKTQDQIYKDLKPRLSSMTDVREVSESLLRDVLNEIGGVRKQTFHNQLTSTMLQIVAEDASKVLKALH